MRSKSLTSLLMRIRQMVGPRPIFNLFFFFSKIRPIVSKYLRRYYRSSIMYSLQEFRKSKNSMRFFFQKKVLCYGWLHRLYSEKSLFFKNLLINSQRSENLFSYLFCKMKQQCFSY